MIHKLTLLLSTVLLSLTVSATTMVATSYPDSNQLFTEMLQKHLTYTPTTSTVDYASWKKQDALKLKTYLQSLEKVTSAEFEKMNRQQQMAFLINAYNAFTVQLILNHYPVKSIKKIGGWFKSPWKMKSFKLLGKERHLDWIEHEVLRPKYKDPRIHYAVNCASIGCPRLRNEAFNDKMLDIQLNEQQATFFADASRNRIDVKNKKLMVSKIFDWFEEDFTNLRSYLAKQLTKNPQLQTRIVKENWEIDFTDYNWNLNSTK